MKIINRILIVMILAIAISIPVAAYASDKDEFCQLVKEMSTDIATAKALGQTKQQLFNAVGIDKATYSILTNKLFKAIANLAYNDKMKIDSRLHARAFGMVIYNKCIETGGVSF